MKTALTFLVIVLALSLSFAQAAKKIPVAVVHSGDDSVGRNVAFAPKEAIRSSQSFNLVDDDPLPKTPRIVVNLVSLDITARENSKGLSSAIPETIVYASSPW